jgi:hypothetical protein
MSLLLLFAPIVETGEPPVEGEFDLALTTQVELRVAATQTNFLDLSSPNDPLNYLRTFTLGDGTGLDQADKIFHDTRTLAASATEDLDMAGVLTNAFGQVVTFARIKLILIHADLANTNNVNVTRPAANGLPIFIAAGDGIAVRPNGIFFWFAPDATGTAVTAGTGDLLTITNSGGTTSVTYKVVIIGAGS